MYPQYLDSLMRYYHMRQTGTNLLQRLVRPTPGSMKKECLSACAERFEPRDLGVLSAFFGTASDREGMLRAIRRCDRDRFRPLIYYITGRIQTTHHVNIELLAWLIDFPARPFILGKPVAEVREGSDKDDDSAKAELPEKPESGEMMEGSPSVNEAMRQPIDEERERQTAAIASNEMTLVPRRRVLWSAVAALLLLLTGFYIVVENKSAVTARFSIPETGHTNELVLSYARCVGASPCRACSNCSQCNWCNSGGTCSKCAASPPKKSTQKRALQCKEITKKGTRCRNTAKQGSEYCWVHISRQPSR